MGNSHRLQVAPGEEKTGSDIVWTEEEMTSTGTPLKDGRIQVGHGIPPPDESLVEKVMSESGKDGAWHPLGSPVYIPGNGDMMPHSGGTWIQAMVMYE